MDRETSRDKRSRAANPQRQISGKTVKTANLTVKPIIFTPDWLLRNALRADTINRWVHKSMMATSNGAKDATTGTAMLAAS
jgi:hypothetical protein